MLGLLDSFALPPAAVMSSDWGLAQTCFGHSKPNIDAADFASQSNTLCIPRLIHGMAARLSCLGVVKQASCDQLARPSDKVNRT